LIGSKFKVMCSTSHINRNTFAIVQTICHNCIEPEQVLDRQQALDNAQPVSYRWVWARCRSGNWCGRRKELREKAIYIRDNPTSLIQREDRRQPGADGVHARDFVDALPKANLLKVVNPNIAIPPNDL
jgi:hypothetical protein